MYVVVYETSSKWTLFNIRFIAMFITTVCVLFLIKLRWPKENSVYDLNTVRVLGKWTHTSPQLVLEFLYPHPCMGSATFHLTKSSPEIYRA